jgi:hypothetical protein
MAAWLLVFGSLAVPGWGRVVINEVMAVNNSGLTDQDGDSSDWIELCNEGGSAVNLSGWYLTDRATNLRKWAFPAVTLLPGQYLVVFASDKNRRVAGQELHTNFGLSGDGEYLALVQADGVTVEFAYSPAFPAQFSDVSYGIATDRDATMVGATSAGRLLIPGPLVGDSWLDHVGFDDSVWRSVRGSIGYELSPGTYAPYLSATVSVSTVSMYLRYTFALNGTEEYDRLVFSAQYDDGFAAYLNGVLVAQSNAPSMLTYTSTATAVRSNAEAVNYQAFDVSAYRGALVDGNNVLSVHAMNASSGDPDMLIGPKLIGVVTNGAVPLRFFTTPTPGSVNAAGYEDQAGKPAFSLEGGFYTNAQTVVLSASGAGAVIRYTLDGSEPTSSSPIYAAPLSIQSRAGETNIFSMIPTAPTSTGQQWSWLPIWEPPQGEVFKATVVRARVFAPGMIPSPIATQTYFVDPGMFRRYGTLPVISLVTDRKNFFDAATGIYVPGNKFTGSTYSGNYYQRWEKPVHMEWYETNGVAGFRQDMGVRIQGNTSVASPHKGLSLFTRSEYGKSSLKYPLFSGVGSDVATRDEFKRFMLRGWGSYRGRGLLYDPFTHILLDRWDLDIQDYRPCVVFVNGEYWGLQELREANKNSFYLEDEYDVDRDDPGYDILYGSGPYTDFDPDGILDYSYVDEGDYTNWHATMDFLNNNSMAVPANYAQAQTRIDVDNYILYMVHSSFGVKADWPNQNEAKYRPRLVDGRWRWLQFDLDHCFQDSYTTDMLSGNVFPHNVYVRLKDSPEFRARFINTYADLMNSDFRADVMLTRFDAMVAQLRPVTNEFMRRWPIISGENLDSWWAQMRNNVANRTAFERENVRTKFGLGPMVNLKVDAVTPGRGKVRVNRLELDANLRGVTNGVYPWTGLYYPGVSMQAAAIPEDGYQFAGWQGLSTNRSNPLTFTLAGSSNLTAVFAPFDQATFPLRISEVMYHPAAGAGVLVSNEVEFVELYNAGASTLNLRDVTFTDGIAFTFAADRFLPAGGHVVLVNNLAAFAARYNTNAVPVAGVYGGSLANSGERLRLKATPYGPTLVSFSYGDGREWPLTADGAGHSLVPALMDEPLSPRLSHGAYWRASAYRHGSPGVADPAPPVDVVLNEVMAHTDYDDPVNFPGYDSNDWIELFNRAAGAVSLAGWYLSDDGDELKKWAIPAVHTVGAGAWISFDEISGFHSPLTNGFGLNKAGEELFLSYLPGTAMDRVADGVRLKGQANDISLGRYVDGAPAWYAMTPTRGSANGAPLGGLVISEWMPHPVTNAAAPDGDPHDEFIEIHNPTAAPLALYSGEGPWRLDGGVQFAFPAGLVVPAGGYLAVVSFSPALDIAERDAFLFRYGLTNGQVQLVGPFEGKLANEGDRVTLEWSDAPDVMGGDTVWGIQDEVLFAPYAPWPSGFSGSGASLQRQDPSRAGVLPEAWRVAAIPTPGAGPRVVGVAQPIPGSRLLLPVTGVVSVVVDTNLLTGAVQSVAFYQGATWLGSDPTAPYAVPLPLLDATGPHVFSAVLTDGAGAHASAPATVSAQRVDNASGATDVGEFSAQLHGRLLGSGAATLSFYWGRMDGGSNALGWEHVESVGEGDEGAFARVVGGLELGQEYWYRAHASNDWGVGWATESTPFGLTYDQWPHTLRITLRGLTTADVLTNFPALVILSTNIPGFRYDNFGRADGGDLRFSTGIRAAALPYEVESWDTNGVSHVWVQVPRIAPGATELWAFRGNPAALPPASATNGAVWNSGCQRVYHFQSGLADSSAYRAMASVTGTAAVAGIVAGGRSLDGVDDWIHPGLSAAWYGSNSAATTVSLWVRPTAEENATAWGGFGGGRDTPFYITQSSGAWKFLVGNTSGVDRSHAVLPGEWQMLTLVLNNGLGRAYRDGLPSAATFPYPLFTPSRDPLIGKMNGQSGAEYHLSGTVDDVRIASAAWTPAWVRACYLTVASNAMVTTFGDGPLVLDDDTDGLPDAWERDFFGGTQEPDGDALDDWDGDGALNGAEFVAGTDPTDPDDRFRIGLVTIGPSLQRIELFGLPGDAAYGVADRFYAIEECTPLLGASWAGIPAFTNVRGMASAIWYTNTAPATTPRYFRGRVWIVSP